MTRGVKGGVPWQARCLRGRSCGIVVAVLALGLAPGALARCDQQTALARPIPLGTSGGSINLVRKVTVGNVTGVVCAGGTLGALVQDTSGRQFILSNNHVIARSNAGRPGEPIVQPGLHNVQCQRQAHNAVARLSRRITIRFGPAGSNAADAAIALVKPGKVSSQIENIGPISGVPATPAVGLAVQKMGGATCLTLGRISAVGVDVVIGGYGAPGKPGKAAMFHDQIMMTNTFGLGPLGEAGDSGSLIVTTDPCPQPVALLFAGNESATLANPLGPILSTLNVAFVGGCTAAPGQASPALARSDRMAVTSARVTRAAAVRDANRETLMRIPGAIGTGIGVGSRAGSVAIEVYVATLTPDAQAAAPTRLGHLPVRLRETGAFVAF